MCIRDSSEILFICGGTFVGVDDIIRRRLGKRTIGFGQQAGFKEEGDLGEILPQVTSDDILEFGLIPELVGRLPVVSSLGPLSEEGLISVLTEPKNALVKQFESLFQMENCELNFSEAALSKIARKAQEKGTGARGLRSIVEQVMLDIMYDLPEKPKGTKITIDADTVDGAYKHESFSMPESKSA